MFEKNLKNVLGTQKKNRKKNRRKNDVFFFEVPTAKNIFQPDFFFFNFVSLFFFWPSILYRSLKRLGGVRDKLEGMLI